MTTSITALQGSDGITTSNSMAKINNNFDSLNTNKIETSYLDTDTSLTADSDTKIATQKAVKAYVDAGGDPTTKTRLVPVGTVFPYAGSSAPTYYLLCDGSAKSTSTYADLFAVIGYTYGGSAGTFYLPDLRARTPIGIGAVTKVATFVSRSSNVITVSGLSNTSNNEFQTGQAVLYSAPSGAMTGLTHNTTYYVIRVSNSTISLASSLANAQNGTVIALSSDGTGTQTFTLTLTTRTLGETGGEETHAMTTTELVSHNHPLEFVNGAGSGLAFTSGSPAQTSSYTTITNPLRVGSYGGNVAMNNMQPYIGLNYIIKY